MVKPVADIDQKEPQVVQPGKRRAAEGGPKGGNRHAQLDRREFLTIAKCSPRQASRPQPSRRSSNT